MLNAKGEVLFDMLHLPNVRTGRKQCSCNTFFKVHSSTDVGNSWNKFIYFIISPWLYENITMANGVIAMKASP